MNTIFVKEVSDTVLNGKLVKLNYTNINDDECILELNIGSRAIKNILKDFNKMKYSVINEPKKLSWVNVLIQKIIVKKIKRIIEKIVKKNDLVGYSVIYANDLKKNIKAKEYIDGILNRFSINEYLCLNTVKDNMLKYINEYMTNNNIKNEDLNPVLFVKELEKLDIALIKMLNSKYKEVTIFSINRATKSFQNKIKRINDEYGSCIQILNKSEKDFKRYNVYIFVDVSRTEYSKCKFNRRSCFIDFTNKENDKFNEKYIKLEKGIMEGFYYNNKIKELYSLYGKITVSNAIIN